MTIDSWLSEHSLEIEAWRRDFHAHPELLFDLPRTSGIVADKLREFGCDEVVEGVGGSGVVAVVKGKMTGSGRIVGFRADMDALPILEKTGVPHASKTIGRMHACGHDGHTAILLGAARYLAETRDFDGTVVLIFQPAEESAGGGAQAMIADHVLDRWKIEEIYGLHNIPGMPLGQFAIRSGPIMAAADTFEIKVCGKGGHGAMPHLSVDATLAASAIVLAVQSIVTRNVSPTDSAVISVCGFQTETMASSVMPEEVLLIGTVRTFDARVKNVVKDRLCALAASTAAAYGAAVTFAYFDGAPTTVNAHAPTEFAVKAARSVCTNVETNVAPVMWAEDFAYMLMLRPGAYIFLGNGPSADLHNPNYEFDDRAIPAGCGWFVALAEQRMPLLNNFEV